MSATPKACYQDHPFIGGRLLARFAGPGTPKIRCTGVGRAENRPEKAVPRATDRPRRALEVHYVYLDRAVAIWLGACGLVRANAG